MIQQQADTETKKEAGKVNMQKRYYKLCIPDDAIVKSLTLSSKVVNSILLAAAEFASLRNCSILYLEKLIY